MKASEQARRTSELFKNFADQILAVLNSGSISVNTANFIFKPVDEFFSETKDAKLSPDGMDMKAQLLTTYSDVLVGRGQNARALELARQAKSLAEQLVAKDRSNAAWQYVLYSALFRIADAVAAQGETQANLQAMLTDYRRAQTIAQTLSERNPDDGDRLYDLAFINNKVGETLQLQYQKFQMPTMPEATKQYQAALRIARVIAAKNPGQNEWKAYLPITLTKVGYAMASLDPPDLTGALVQYAEALDIQKKLVKSMPNNAIVLSNQARTHGLIGDALVRRNAPGDFERAKKAYQSAIEINQDLVSCDPASATWLGFLASKYRRLAKALEEHGDLNGALAEYQKELVSRQKLVDKDPHNDAWQKSLAKCSKRIAALQKSGLATGSIGGSSSKPTTPAPGHAASAGKAH